jgi:hypothetical protein
MDAAARDPPYKYTVHTDAIDHRKFIVAPQHHSAVGNRAALC